MTNARIVLTTIDTAEKAHALAHALVERRLAACVNVVDRVHSVYRWQGIVETADEVLLVIKTVADNIAVLEKAIQELHPYQLPEFLVLGVDAAEVGYLGWIAASTS
ncbi:MAG TPA: divalent-cation tolerance protein CutA [Acidobacteriaceae bacterium]|nr:divalent-cation tolerance protein CutA [Acidobacteriaceae bacterium]